MLDPGIARRATVAAHAMLLRQYETAALAGDIPRRDALGPLVDALAVISNSSHALLALEKEIVNDR